MNERIKSVVRAAVALIDDLAFPEFFVEYDPEPEEVNKMRDLFQACKALTPQDLAECGVEESE